MRHRAGGVGCWVAAHGRTGLRAEEELGFNAEPYVRTGKFVKILGL